MLDICLIGVYNRCMIKTFADKETEGIYNQKFSRQLPVDIQRTALKKMIMLNAAHSINDLRVPPHNHLESLKGDRAGQHSIRINKAWRICFVERDGDFYDVEIVDYH